MPDPTLTPEQIEEAEGILGPGLRMEEEALRVARALAERDRRLAAEKMAVKHLRRQVAERDARIAELKARLAAVRELRERAEREENAVSRGLAESVEADTWGTIRRLLDEILLDKGSSFAASRRRERLELKARGDRRTDAHGKAP